jgi:lipopolysaccharide transport system ATP-binding protein
MSDTVIRVENLSKKYVLGKNGRSEGLRHAIQNFATAPLRWLKNRPVHAEMLVEKNGALYTKHDSIKDYWALSNVSFEIRQGEVVGVIGRNGAGKSTLLKILSRITEQTEGRVEITGRVASLLEVGTGFHPELTGRENIFLNGAILGMSRAEIRKKFDEIVAFAEVEKFLDTPVKRYSSGMYVRLAFAVAAHLEPEILIVDEVLAVGDAQFQKKCLGKMQEVSKGGRTVLFVSHNMEAVLKLCNRGILLANGRVSVTGAASKVASIYLEGQISSAGEVDLREKPRPQLGYGAVQLVGASPLTDQEIWSYPFGRPLAIQVHVEAKQTINNVELGIGLFSARGYELASWTSSCSDSLLSLKTGLNTVRIEYTDLKLVPGQYYFGIGLRSERGLEDYVPEAVWFEIVVSDESAKASAHIFGGAFVPNVEAQVIGQ